VAGRLIVCTVVVLHSTVVARRKLSTELVQSGTEPAAVGAARSGTALVLVALTQSGIALSTVGLVLPAILLPVEAGERSGAQLGCTQHVLRSVPVARTQHSGRGKPVERTQSGTRQRSGRQPSFREQRIQFLGQPHILSQTSRRERTRCGFHP
jgi:hypothetical protein